MNQIQNDAQMEFTLKIAELERTNKAREAVYLKEIEALTKICYRLKYQLAKMVEEFSPKEGKNEETKTDN